MHFHYRVTFTGYILFLVLLRRMTLWFWPLTFWPWECFMYSASHVWATYQFLLSYDYWLLSYEYWISDHISVIWNSHCACAVSRDLWPGAKIVHIFEFPDPNLPIHFFTFTTLRRRLSHVIGKKIAFSHYEGYKVYFACTVSRDLCIGGPPKPHVTIFWPRIAYSL